MKSTGPAIAAAAMVLATLVLLYLLSIGPAARLYGRGILTREIEIVYAPLEWVADRATFLQGPIEFYVQLWTPREPLPTPLPNPTPLAVPVPPPPSTSPAGS